MSTVGSLVPERFHFAFEKSVAKISKAISGRIKPDYYHSRSSALAGSWHVSHAVPAKGLAMAPELEPGKSS